MNSRDLIGRREDQRLEFKSTDALKRPFTVSREVVAMLNAGGGEIWVGIREDRGVATAVEGVLDANRAREDLLNHLIDVVEPAAVPDAVAVNLVQEADSDALLQVVVREGRDRPYALLKDQGRQFLIRADHRVRAMTREEIIRPASSTAAAADPEREARAKLQRRRDAVLQRRRDPLLWIGSQPISTIRVETWPAQLRSLLTSPREAGNRESGWNYQWPFGEPPRSRNDRFEFGDRKGRLTTVYRDGGLDFLSTMIHLEHDVRPKQELYPLALTETVVSIARLVRKLSETLGVSPPPQTLFQLALQTRDGAVEWTLPSFAPGTLGHAVRFEPPRRLEDGAFLPEALLVSWQDLDDNPDWVGFRLVRQVYGAFGLGEDRIPGAFDRNARRFVLTD